MMTTRFKHIQTFSNLTACFKTFKKPIRFLKFLETTRHDNKRQNSSPEFFKSLPKGAEDAQIDPTKIQRGPKMLPK